MTTAMLATQALVASALLSEGVAVAFDNPDGTVDYPMPELRPETERQITLKAAEMAHDAMMIGDETSKHIAGLSAMQGTVTGRIMGSMEAARLKREEKQKADAEFLLDAALRMFLLDAPELTREAAEQVPKEQLTLAIREDLKRQPRSQAHADIMNEVRERFALNRGKYLFQGPETRQQRRARERAEAKGKRPVAVQTRRL